mmetsp:Transcript_13917/g.21690  ORF Transcript_13917/g.21690 Transcript_13917/m.21690 type:complete len:183 (+) Transcript_13917:40-588(+)|eukprot:CAMPEP_0170491676 /NCGR_PEP_ID=MMETSP0208-20121228/11189_1 /TAXON_ID=197538 /ORGANISM="Strombidium inclinatum, Strain S3" /LENGTH=182 /DNA_ID=CAMNT_0010767291 /DNA_START=13 /DNA_END=561 /DNA_ORIENTATION=-
MKTHGSRTHQTTAASPSKTLSAFNRSSSKEVHAFKDLFEEGLPTLSKRGSRRNDSEPPLKRSTSTGTSLAHLSGLGPVKQPSLQKRPSNRKLSRKLSLAGSEKVEPRKEQVAKEIDGQEDEPQPSQDQVNKLFQKELKRVYDEVDRFSGLLWAQRSSDELCNRRGATNAKPTLRSGLNDEDK